MYSSVRTQARNAVRQGSAVAGPCHFTVAETTAPLRKSVTQGRGPTAGTRLTAMSAMASTLVHELSQPICASQNYLQATAYRLRNQIAGLEELLDAVSEANAQSRKAGEIIARMREFMVNGTVAGQHHDLRELVENGCTMLRPALPIELIRKLSPDAVDVIADRIQIGQVLSNLLTNAVDAVTGAGERRITVESRAIGDMVEIRVSDTGIGLSDDDLAQMFDPFYTTKETGTGLGLALCRMIVEAHGGEIWAETGGEGATIAFTLQAARVER